MMSDAIAALFSSGAICIVILTILALEAAVLMVVLPGRLAERALDVAGLTVPGACLVTALYAAITGAGWHWIASALTVAFAAHLTDLSRRFAPRLSASGQPRRACAPPPGQKTP